MTTQTNNATTTEAPATGFAGLKCPACGEPDMVRLDLPDLDTVTCASCEAELSLRKDIAPQMAMWAKVLKWVAAAADIQG